MEEERKATEQVQNEVQASPPTPQAAVEENTNKTLSDDENLNKKLKIVFILFIVIVIVWFLALSPFLTFKKNEKILTDGAKRFYSTYSEQLPTGKRVGTKTLQELFDKGMIEEDLYVPYSLFEKKSCSLEKSWVKVVKKGDEYKYYTYLDCGIMKSSVDHAGPKVTLNGSKNIILEYGDDYKELGVSKVVDGAEGKLDPKDVEIKQEINNKKIGDYTVEYTARDSLNNVTKVTRTVTVVRKLNTTVKKATENTGTYTGLNPDNYISFSGMLWRIIDLENDNVRLVTDESISKVEYDGIEDWLKYFYDNLQDESKKLIVKNKYCNMVLKETDFDTTECASYTGKLNVYYPSIIDVNKTKDGSGSFIRNKELSWIANSPEKNEAYAVNLYSNEPRDMNDKYPLGVRPEVTISGNTYILRGKGTKESPFIIGDTEKGKPDEKVNERFPGEYLNVNGYIWRIIKSENDGTTKVIYNGNLAIDSLNIYTDYFKVDQNIYNPKEKNNVGYEINNKTSEALETKLFVKHEIEVPIYKKYASFKKTGSIKKYTVKFAAPNMYEMFSGTFLDGSSYWFLNSSEDLNINYAVEATGSPAIFGNVTTQLGVRPVGFLHKNCSIISGEGTKENPYVIGK